MGFLAVFALACGRPTHEIDLEVRSAENDTPIVGARVIVAGRGWGRADDIVWDHEYKVTGTTDTEGRYRAELLSAPFGLPAGGQQPHLIRISKEGFDTLFTTIAVDNGRIVGTLVLEAAGTTRERRRLQEEALQKIRTVSLRVEGDQVLVDVTLKPDAVFPSEVSLELRLGRLRCGEQRLEILNATQPIVWSLETARLLDCYVEKSGVRGGAMADVFLRVDARLESEYEFMPVSAVREEVKVELDFVSHDPTKHSLRILVNTPRL